MIEVKKLSSEHWQEYRDLRLEALRQDTLAFGGSYEEEVTKSDAEWKKEIENVLFAMADEKAIGMIKYMFHARTKIRHIANIYGVYVSQDYRSRGVGKMLMEAALMEIRNNPEIIKINLHVNPVQEAAQKLYESFGFEPVGTLKKDLFIDGRFYDEVIMEKYL